MKRSRITRSDRGSKVMLRLDSENQAARLALTNRKTSNGYLDSVLGSTRVKDKRVPKLNVFLTGVRPLKRREGDPVTRREEIPYLIPMGTVYNKYHTSLCGSQRDACLFSDEVSLNTL